ASQPTITVTTGIAFGLADPLADGGLGQVEVPGDLPDRPVAPTAQLHDLGLELRCERPARSRLPTLHALHDGHPPRATTPDIGCPSNRVRPRTACSGVCRCRFTVIVLLPTVWAIGLSQQV